MIRDGNLYRRMKKIFRLHELSGTAKSNSAYCKDCMMKVDTEEGTVRTKK